MIVCINHSIYYLNISTFFSFPKINTFKFVFKECQKFKKFNSFRLEIKLKDERNEFGEKVVLESKYHLFYLCLMTRKCSEMNKFFRWNQFKIDFLILTPNILVPSHHSDFYRIKFLHLASLKMGQKRNGDKDVDMYT